ncbi:MAG: response regulator [Sedimenticola sp.]
MIEKESNNRLLVVDDSPTARALLSKKLFEHGLDVDTVSSAGEAIDYLYDKRPKAIFMDYQMPGMDGLQALKVIKGNPSTALIPVMMYTSQEGGLHIGQARALGAIGVLPKIMEYDELRTILANLNLLPGMENHASVERCKEITAEMEDPEGNSYELSEQPPLDLNLLASDAIKPVAKPSHHGYQNRQMALILKQYENSWVTFEKSLDDKLQRIEKQVKETIEVVRHRGNSGATTLLSMGVIISLSAISTWFYQETTEARDQRGELISEIRKLERQSMLLLTRYPLQPDTLPITTDQPRIKPAATHPPLTKENSQHFTLPAIPSINFNYGESAFNDERIPLLRKLLKKLEAGKFQGKVHLTSHLARFCLHNIGEKPVPNDDFLPLSDCQFSETDPLIAEREGAFQTIAFSNFVNEFSDQKITLVPNTAGLTEPATPYPSISSTLTAADWNTVAHSNQRISIRLEYQPTRRR